MSKDWEATRPLTHAELEKIAKNLITESDDESTQESGSETEDAVEVEDFEDSGSDYVPSDDDSSDENVFPRAKKKKTCARKVNEGKHVDNHSLVEDMPGPSRSKEDSSAEQQQPEDAEPDTDIQLQQRIVRVDETIRSQVRLIGKNGHRWSAVPKPASRTPQRNILHILPGPITKFQNDPLPNESFKIFITDFIIDKIVLHTNVIIEQKSSKYKKKSATVSTTNSSEIKALLGLLVLSAYLKSNHLGTKELFDDKICGAVYKAVMSRERFKFLLDSLRFDDKSTREERKKSDALAAIREIWDEFINQCRNSYKPSSYVTIDEQLLAFRGKCPFRMFIPNKPSKYGIKIVMVCDVSSKYMFDAAPYLGKSTNTNGLPLGEYYVKTLCETISGSKRNITMDNWFTSVKLAADLLAPPYNLTMVGTIRKNKREIPPEMLATKNRDPGSSKFCFDKDKVLVSYTPRKNKNVVLLSTMHQGCSISKTGKPEIIETYNQTKGSVDTMDQMCSIMSTSRKTKRWPLCLFYGMLNIGSINSYIVYNSHRAKRGQKLYSRKSYMLELYKCLVTPWLKERIKVPTLQRSLRESIGNLLEQAIPEDGQDIPEERTVPDKPKRTICASCPSRKRRMTIHFCSNCNKPFCNEHRGDICKTCTK